MWEYSTLSFSVWSTHRLSCPISKKARLFSWSFKDSWWGKPITVIYRYRLLYFENRNTHYATQLLCIGKRIWGFGKQGSARRSSQYEILAKVGMEVSECVFVFLRVLFPTIIKEYPIHSTSQFSGQEGIWIVWLWIAITMAGASQTLHLDAQT